MSQENKQLDPTAVVKLATLESLYDTVELAGELASRAEMSEKQAADLQAKVAAAGPGIVDRLIACQFCEPTDKMRKAAFTVMASPVDTLDLLDEVLGSHAKLAARLVEVEKRANQVGDVPPPSMKTAGAAPQGAEYRSQAVLKSNAILRGESL